MIRQAVTGDVPALLELLADGYKRSRLDGVGAIDVTVAKKKLYYMIARSGLRGENGTWCNVVDQREGVVGMHFAMKSRIKEIGTLFYATDVWFYCTRQATPFAVGALLDSFVDWAKKDPAVLEIVPGVDDFIGDFKKTGKLYEARGFTHSGSMYRLSIERARSAA